MKKALLLLLLTGHGKARPQHSKTKSPSTLSRFLNRYPWPTRALLRLTRNKAQEALHQTRPKRGPKPRLLWWCSTWSWGTCVSLGPTGCGGGRERRPFPSSPCVFWPPRSPGCASPSAGGGEVSWWEAGREAARSLLPEVVLRVLMAELGALDRRPPPLGERQCLCRVFRRCKF